MFSIQSKQGDPETLKNGLHGASPSWRKFLHFFPKGFADTKYLARAVRRDLKSLHPRDMIDVQSFLWVQGSDEYD